MGVAKQTKDTADEQKLVEEAIRQLERGEPPEAYGKLVELHKQRLYSFLNGLTSDPTEAEDVAQEAFVKGFVKLGQFERRSKFATWLFRIAINELRNRHRKAGPIVGPPPTQEEEGHAEAFEPATERTPEEEAASKEVRELVRRAVQELPEEFRIAVTLVDLGGMSYKEAAETLKVPEGTIKSRLARGRRMLKDKLASLGVTEELAAKAAETADDSSS